MERNNIITTENLLRDIAVKKGKAGGWPNYFDYTIDGDSLTISADERLSNKHVARGLDPWGLAVRNYAIQYGIKINTLGFRITGQIQSKTPNIEALRRRISFLNMNNPELNFNITLNGETIELYDSKTLFNRPQAEIIHNHDKQIAVDNKPGRIEKDFQTFLFGHKEKGDEKTNERLAVLGDDFFDLQKKGFGIIREFPTGAFLGKVSNANRILPTEFVDIVTLNKHRELAVIELKLNDTQLEVMAQTLDYALFFRCYKDKLLPILEKLLRHEIKGAKFICYVVNNRFHDKFDDVMKYYITKNNSYGFQMIKIVLGYSPPY